MSNNYFWNQSQIRMVMSTGIMMNGFEWDSAESERKLERVEGRG